MRNIFAEQLFNNQNFRPRVVLDKKTKRSGKLARKGKVGNKLKNELKQYSR